MAQDHKKKTDDSQKQSAMRERWKKSWILSVVVNETGQMSIFIALIFQILFVFFAMVINVGLLVHDKINLQNAVDLGAYYAAQRQAEIMNEIAHVNYQMRQDWKLLAWRYRVLGTLGRQGKTNPPTEQTLPPARKQNPGSPDTEWVNPDYGAEDPSVCVSNEMWKEMVLNSDQEENYCFGPFGQTVPKIPDVVIIAPFVPGVAASAAFTKMAQDQQRLSCQNAGPRNWVFAMQMMYGYKLSIATRKEVIWELRKNLISASMQDRNQQLVQDGVLQTIKRNLTAANQAGFETSEFKVINGLADPACNRGDDGEFVLPEIKTSPLMIYTSYVCDDGSMPLQALSTDISTLDQSQVAAYDPSGLYRNLSNEPEITSPYFSSLGFEKNPWCMAYMGVKAKTSTHKPFAPFGKPIELEAKAFAQPFGGRVGPWYKERWTSGAPQSQSGDRLDALAGPRVVGTAVDMSGSDPKSRLPNYSRYPGDTLGLKAMATLGAEAAIIKSFAPPVAKTNRLSLIFYAGFDPIPQTGDVLAQNATLRQAEIAAVTPDLFDAVYYSIDPNFTVNYVATGPDRFSGAQPVFGQQIKEIPDAGGVVDTTPMSVELQIKTALSGGLDPSVKGRLYYVLQSWTHLLTGWVQSTVQNFTFPQAKFAQCSEVASDDVMIPGKCTVGGRVGYSVRLISKSHLTFANWKIGGDGESEGPILNPPKDGF